MLLKNLNRKSTDGKTTGRIREEQSQGSSRKLGLKGTEAGRRNEEWRGEIDRNREAEADRLQRQRRADREGGRNPGRGSGLKTLVKLIIITGVSSFYLGDFIQKKILGVAQSFVDNQAPITGYQANDSFNSLDNPLSASQYPWISNGYHPDWHLRILRVLNDSGYSQPAADNSTPANGDFPRYLSRMYWFPLQNLMCLLIETANSISYLIDREDAILLFQLLSINVNVPSTWCWIFLHSFFPWSFTDCSMNLACIFAEIRQLIS